MSISAPRAKQKYTYADYLNWPDEEKWEIINGVPYDMSPAPSTEHQRILGELFVPLALYSKGKKCNVFTAPFDVRLPRRDEKNDEINTVVQPDIVVVCDPNKLDERGCKGAPDMVIEILSHATAKKDLSEKFNLYEINGVKEYWVVFPAEKALDIYRLNLENRYEKSQTYFSEDTLSSELFPGLEIKLEEVFR